MFFYTLYMLLITTSVPPPANTQEWSLVDIEIINSIYNSAKHALIEKYLMLTNTL